MYKYPFEKKGRAKKKKKIIKINLCWQVTADLRIKISKFIIYYSQHSTSWIIHRISVTSWYMDIIMTSNKQAGKQISLWHQTILQLWQVNTPIFDWRSIPINTNYTLLTSLHLKGRPLQSNVHCWDCKVEMWTVKYQSKLFKLNSERFKCRQHM